MTPTKDVDDTLLENILQEDERDEEAKEFLDHQERSSQEGRGSSQRLTNSSKSGKSDKKEKTDWEELVTWFYKWTDDGMGMIVALCLFVLTIAISAAGGDLSDGYSSTSEWPLGAIGVAFFAILSTHYLMGKEIQLQPYCLMLVIAVVARSIGNYEPLRDSGLSASLWAILMGIFFRYIGVKLNFKKVYGGEFFVKIGVTLLAMDFTSIVSVGLPGLLVAWVDTLIILSFGSYVCMKLMSFTIQDSIVIAGATSICGSSAATALSSAVHQKGYDDPVAKTIIAIMGVFNAPLMPIMPLFKTLLGMNPTVVGSWIGGSIDSTGQVTASAQMGGDIVLRSAIIIKMAQNILIGPLCLLFTGYFQKSMKFSLLVSKFPPFVTGFLITSTIATIFLQISSISTDSLQDLIIANAWCVSEWITLIGFVGIGLEIDIRELFHRQENQTKHKIFLIYLVIQTVDVFTTLGWSYLMFRDNSDNDDDYNSSE